MSSFLSTASARALRFGAALLLGVVLAASANVRAATTAATPEGFDPEADSNVYATVVQSDGKVLIGGAFISVKPFNRGSAYPRSHICRLNTDGTVDESFDPKFDGDVNVIRLQADGKILVGGSFTKVASSGSSTEVARTGLARLNADGSVDAGFDPHPTGASTGETPVSAIVVQSDGKIVVGGAFTALQPNGASSSTARLRLARLNADGSLDASFNPAANNLVLALAIQADGKILAGGGFTQLSPNGTAVTRTRLARLNTDGTVDASFNVTVDNRVLSLAVHPSGDIMFGGEFLNVQGTNDTSATTRVHLARVKSSGAIDTTFSAAASARVNSLVFGSDGKILIGGAFQVVQPSGSITYETHHYIARLTYAGTIDSSFAPTPTAEVTSIALQSDDRMVIGGYFTHVRGTNGSVSALRNRVARLQADGTLDTGFSLNPPGTISAMVRQSDGKVVLAGNFSTLAGVTRRNIARINADGTLDTNFKPVVSGAVASAVLQSDGKIVIVGEFTAIDSVSRLHIARLNTDGSLDTSYDPKANGSIYSIILQSDGKVVVGGGFTTFAPNGATTTTAINYLARINTDGTLDSAFMPGPNNVVYALALQSDGKILAGGAFTTFAPNNATSATTRYYVGRLQSDGKVDTSFSPTLSDYAYSLALADSKIIVAGRFTSVASTNSTTAVSRNYIARYDSAGVLDTAFDPNANGTVYALLPVSDGVYIGGAFTTLQPNGASSYTNEGRIAKLNTDGSLTTAAVPSFDGEVHSLAALADNSILVGGAFSSYTTTGGQVVQTESHVAHLASSGTPDTSYAITTTSGSAGTLSAIALQQDGEMLVGGTFTNFGGGITTNLSRMTANGDVDTSFTTNVNQTVSAIAVQPTSVSEAAQANLLGWLQSNGHYRDGFSLNALSSLAGYIWTTAIQPDGKLLVGGLFTNSSGLVSANLVRFNPDGSFDTSFNPSPNGAIRSFAILSNGDILVAGSFTSVSPNGATTATTRNYIAKLKSDGSVDTTFNPNANNSVYSICVQSDGKILIGGAFTTLNPNSASTTATARAYIARLNADGTLDTSFNPTANGSVLTIVTDGGKIIAGGSFTTVQPNGATSATARNYIARFNSDGTLDTSYNPNANAAVASIVRLSDSRTIIGGSFTALQPNGASTSSTHYYIARLNEDGTADASFSPQLNGDVTHLAVAPDDSVYVSGSFSAVYASDFITSVTRNRVAHFRTDGTLDLSFNPNANGVAYSVERASDGSIVVAGAFTKLGADSTVLIGGSFTQVGGANVSYISRLTTDGNPDTAFSPVPNAPVRALAVHSDGRFYAAGEFTQVTGVARGHIARFSRDGTLDAGFAPSIDGNVQVVVLLPNGRILIGGDFTNVNGTTRARLARLNSDGSLDTSFNASADGSISAIVPLGNGQILVGGEFANISGGANPRLARLNSDGSLDSSFRPAPDGAVRTIALQASGKLYVGGEFQNIAGKAQARIARLNSDGSYDSTVAPTIDGPVQTIVLRADGRAYFGGSFTTVNGSPSFMLGRLAATESAVQRLSINASRTTLSWTRSGSAPSFSNVLFSYSTDGSSWTNLGEGTHSTFTEVWQWSGGALPDATIYYIRAVGVEASSRNSSSGVVEGVWQFFGSTAVGPNGGTSSSGSSGSSDSSGSSGSSGSGTSGGDSNSGSNGSGGSNSGGSVTTGSGMANLSTRIQLAQGETVITGFILSGTGSKNVLVRAVGPGLLAYGVNNPVSKPTLTLYNGDGQAIRTGVQWESDASIATAFASSGAFPLPSGSADSVTVASLAPGPYTVHVANAAGTAGVVLTEVYDVDHDTTQSHFMNLSARATTSTGENVLIGGFIVQGTAAHPVLIRGLGPALQQYGINSAISNPILRIYNKAGDQIGQNDDWSEAEVGAATAKFPAATKLTAGSKDSAILLTLEPGAYTAIVTDVNGSTGTAMIEILDAN